MELACLIAETCPSRKSEMVWSVRDNTSFPSGMRPFQRLPWRCLMQTPHVTRRSTRLPVKIRPQSHLRHSSSSAFPNASPDALPHKPAPHRNPNEPVYQLTFTCKKCLNRSSHTVSKQGYHKGTVLITCPGCKNRHLISDHLKIFSDTSITVEDIMAKQGEAVKRGTISAEGDVEFWSESATAAGDSPEAKSPKSLSEDDGNLRQLG